MADHAIFTPNQRHEILEFFRHHNYVVVSDALSPEDLQFLNDFVDRSQREIPVEWGVDKKAVYSHAQLLVLYPELDPYIRAKVVFPIVEAIMEPEVRFAQFDFRDVPEGAGDNASMRFHKDRGQIRHKDPDGENRYECTYLCSIHYMSDVDEDSPCFCVVPNSHPHTTIEEAREQMGEAYHEIPIRGPAGTVVLYNIAIFHTRRAGRVERGRRTLHHYYSRAASPPLTDWVLIPQRLTEHPDPALRAYYSQWTEATRAYVKTGYSMDYYKDNVMDKPT